MQDLKKITLVIGASTNPARYAYLAIQQLVAKGHQVKAIGLREGTVAGIKIVTSMEVSDDIDTITLYLNPRRQEMYYDYILKLHPRRIIFNPGTENESLQELAEDAGIKTLEACTLVMLATGQY